MRINPGFIINKIIKIIYRPALRNCIVDKTSKIGAGSNCICMKIGKYSYMGKNNSLCNVDIGNYCSIASYCAIGGGAHPTNYVSTSPIFYNKKDGPIIFENNKKVIIGNDVWIGESVFIKDGIKIGNGAIIGAHSVVTHDIPSYAIVAGAPAKIIRYRFTERQIKELEEIKWWNMNDKELKKVLKNFDNIDQFLKAVKK